MPFYGLAIFPLSNSVAFSPAVNNGLTAIRQDTYKNNIRDWQTLLPYSQKVLNTDTLTIMVHTEFAFTAMPKLYVCDQGKNEITSVDLSTAPYYKGFQSHGFFADPTTGSVMQLMNSLWSFRFSDLVSQIPVGGIYYLRLDNPILAGPVVQYYSEPMLVSNTHPDTMLYQFEYNTNNAAKSIIIDGWWNDYPTSSVPYSPVFGIRAEGYVIPSISGPKGINIGYFEQGYDPLQIKTQQKRFFDLHLGDISLGVPWYMLEMVTEALMADNVALMNAGDSNAYSYVLYSNSGSDNLADVWKVKGSDVNPLLYASCNLMQRSDQQSAFITPLPIPVGGRVFDGSFDSVFA